MWYHRVFNLLSLSCVAPGARPGPASKTTLTHVFCSALPLFFVPRLLVIPMIGVLVQEDHIPPAKSNSLYLNPKICSRL